MCLEALGIAIVVTIHTLEMMIDMGEVIDGMIQGKEVVHMEITEEVVHMEITEEEVKVFTEAELGVKSVHRPITQPKDAIFVLIILCLLEMKLDLER